MAGLRIGSLFTGIGGIDIGFCQAGHKIVFANEIDKDSCITYRNNFHSNILIEGDIRSIEVETIPDIDVLTAGFPCQPFSVMGYRRGFKDPRGNVFFEIARIIDNKKPRIVFLENVRNLIYHDRGKSFSVVYSTLAQFGYAVRYKIVNANEMNVPQNRARVFIIGFLDIEECDRFHFPEPQRLTRGIDDIINRKAKHSDIYYYNEDSVYYGELNRKVGKDGIYRIDDSGIANKRYDICPTLKANMGTYPDRVPIIRDDYGIRKLTPKECLAFQGFPQDYIFKGVSLESAYKQCGNTVCVPVIRALAERLK